MHRLGTLRGGPASNLIPQVLIGGLMVLVILAGYVLTQFGGSLRPPPVRWAIVLLTLVAVGSIGLYFLRVRPILRLPYDVASWSEPMFLLDIIKLRTGTPFYLPPDDSNSNVYTPVAPTVTYFLAWLLGNPTSIRLYRWILQFYLLLTAVLAALAAWNLLHLAVSRQGRQPSRLWLPFFGAVSFLLAVNAQTNAFNIYLHNDPLTLLVSTLAFWLLTQHARTNGAKWVWMMLFIPAVGFTVKQYLAIWGFVYVLYFYLTGCMPLRRIIAFGATWLGSLLAIVVAGQLWWGSNFRYWVFEVMGSHVLTFDQIRERFADAGWYVVLGLAGGWALTRDLTSRRLLAIWIGWLLMILAAAYTSGITYHPTHYGPATMVGGCFALAALARYFSDEAFFEQSPALQWFRTVVGSALIVSALAGFGFMRGPEWGSSMDVYRYTREIEQEFEGLPADRVLLDLNEWYYLHHNLLMKDRAASLLVHRTPHFGLLERVRHQEYAKILVHRNRSQALIYDIGANRKIEETLLAYYHEVRRIPAVKDANWQYAWMTLGEVSVLEPIPSKPKAASDTPSPSQ